MLKYISLLLATCSWAPHASAQFELSPAGTVDISGLGIHAAGGIGFDPNTGSLWVSDVCGTTCVPAGVGTNEIVEFDPVTGALLSSFDASVIPGLFRGPDTLDVHPITGNLYFATAVSEDQAGIVSQAGTLLNDFPVGHDATASAFSPTGELYIFSDGTIGGTALIHRIDQTTGAIEATLPLTAGLGLQSSSMAFDPISGHAFLFSNTSHRLLEVDISTGAVLSSTPLLGLVPTYFPVAFTFNATGTRLYFIQDNFADADTMYVLDRRGIGVTYCSPAAPNSTGSPAGILALGSRVSSDNDFTLMGFGLPPGQFGYFLASKTQGSFTPPGSDGILCLSGNIGRFNAPGQILSGPTGFLDVDLTSIPVNPSVPVVLGDIWNFQCWYRDSNPGQTSNFTDAVSIFFL